MERDNFREGSWYCVRSQPKHEHIACANLRRKHGLEVFNPSIRFKRPTRRGPVWVNEPLFPGYLFVRFDWSVLFSAVQHTAGVAGIVHFGTNWPTIPDDVIAGLQASVGTDEPRVLEESLRLGDYVEVTGGPFDGLRAVVTRLMPARQRVGVLLEFLGRQSLIELDRNAVLTENAWCSIRFDGCTAVAARAG